MSVQIKRIYLENYKLFTSKSIEFEEYLSVFDGPNGYGKTSIFDAIELLITGSIRRIKDSSILGTIGYSTNFLAKEKTKDVLIKGEFIDRDLSKSLIIALRIPTGFGKSSKKNNPKTIDTLVESYFLPEYDIACENWNKYRVDHDTAQEIRNQYFGEQNIQFFTMLHYIRQEDRLSYFKKNEAERTTEIEDLFGIKDDILKSIQIDQACRQLQQKLRSLHKEIEQLSNDVQNISSPNTYVAAYTALAGGKPKWDQENLGFRGFKSNALFEQLKVKIEGLKELYIHRQEYYLLYDLKEFLALEDEQKALAILAWKVQTEDSDVVNGLKGKNDIYLFLAAQKELIDKQKVSNINWIRLCDILDCSSIGNQFINLVEKVKTASANRTDLQKSLSAMNRARDELKKETQATNVLEKGKCPYCGHEWKESETLEKQFNETKTLINTVLDREFVEYTIAVEQCLNLFNRQCKRRFDAIFDSLEKDMRLQLFRQFSNWQAFQNAAKKFIPVAKRLQISSDQIEIKYPLPEATATVWHIIKDVNWLKDMISADYYELDQKYNFSELYKESFNQNYTLEGLSLESLDQKKEYIENQYYHSFDESLNHLQILREQETRLTDLHEQMSRYSTCLKKAIKGYQQLVIGQIEIPFFLYSSRLLQSYQGGQGVLIKSDGKTVRFTAPGSEHDVLYTMSSGQLSAVLLAFSLALNKIYAGKSFQAILIDDPIQCMDDINMISFVELLRREFNQSQIVISTHEDTFSNYICYKFQKYGLPQQTITLKDS